VGIMFSLPLCRFMLTEIGAICVGEEYPSAEVYNAFPIYGVRIADILDYRKRFECYPTYMVC
jgi:hypothetical protein